MTFDNSLKGLRLSFLMYNIAVMIAVSGGVVGKGDPRHNVCECILGVLKSYRNLKNDYS